MEDMEVDHPPLGEFMAGVLTNGRASVDVSGGIVRVVDPSKDVIQRLHSLARCGYCCERSTPGGRRLFDWVATEAEPLRLFAAAHPHMKSNPAMQNLIGRYVAKWHKLPDPGRA